jgi:outer membrane autotransporter protein
MKRYSILSTKPHVFTVLSICLGIGIAVFISSPTRAAETNLGGLGQTQLQQDTGDAVQITCGGFLNQPGALPSEIPLFATCGAMVHTANDLLNNGQPTTLNLGLTEDELAVSLQQIATEEFAATESMATEINVNQAGNVLTRLVELRSSVRGFSLAGLDYPGKTRTFAEDSLDFYPAAGQRGGAAGGDEPGGRLGAFINGSYSTGDRDDTVWTNEFDFDTYGLTGGIDYRFTDNLVFGVALSYHDVDADFDDKPTVSGGSVDADGWGGFLYGTWYSDRFYVDGLAGYAKTDYDTKRKIFIPNNNASNPLISGNIDETAKGSPDSDDYTLGVGAGYRLGQGALSYGPYARVTYYEVDIDDYQEKGAEASGLNLKVDGQNWESLTSVLGAQVSYAFSQSFGVLVPQGQVGWVHEFENDSEEFSAVYVDDPRQNQLRAETNDPDRDYFELGLGVSAVFKRGTQAFVYYDTVLGFDDVTDHIFTVGGRMEF